ncbi:hypothetical protein [Leucobacter sp. OH1287]|uniref:hypothetical protein n=1 Tax=Leucobacter sp. OH1287 TaxID=2491049 RepID=UPI000F5F3261|nr:hypothetical protein [Leucobacter sp. OH1287]RRD60983.1 hypothetical protein EII30_03960 [Leucobacter sp. OH1287]
MTTVVRQPSIAGTSFTGFGKLLLLSLRGLTRSTSTWVLVAIVGFTAVTAAPLAQYTPAIIAGLLDPAAATALEGTLPEPSWQEAFANWAKNLIQMATFAVIIIGAISFHAHLAGGSVPLILTRFVGRKAYLSAHFIAFNVVTFVTQLVAALVAVLISLIFFSDTVIAAFFYSGLVWWLFTVLLTATICLVESLRLSLGVSLASGLAVFFALFIGGIWSWGAAYTPLGLMNLIGSIATQPLNPLLPVVTTVATVAVLVMLSLRAYDRKNIE